MHAFEKDIPLESDNTNLPWVILRAVHRASRLDGIPARARAVLAALARTVDAKKPYGEIYARRELLSQRAMQSERTFYRSLTDLEAAGLIERPTQRRYISHGLFGRAYLHLSARAAILLGLIEFGEASVPADEPQTSENAAASPAPADVRPQAAPRFQVRNANVADGAISKDLSPTSLQKRQPGQLPRDLERLRPLGFHDYLIFRLMREAREQGKRLSEVVEATWPHLAKAARPINYLRKLLASPVDFGFALRAKAAEKARAEVVAAEKRSAEAFVRGAMGKIFVDAAGLRQYAVDDGGRTLAITDLAEGVVRRSVASWQVAFMQSVTQRTLRPVTARELAQLRDAATALRDREIAAKTGGVSLVPNQCASREPSRAWPLALPAPPALPTSPGAVTRVHEVRPGLGKHDQVRLLTSTAAEALAALRAMRKLPARSPV
ncbi:hypothetical protein [Pandoraea oxalativorans]|nr:hypothetical protein [Pandoraea oxalativorans]